MNVGHLLTQTITYQTSTGVNSAGDPSWSASLTAPARVVYGQQIINGGAGDQINSEAVAVTEIELPLRSRVWLPDTNTGDTSQARTPITVKKAQTPGGYWLYEIYL